MNSDDAILILVRFSCSYLAIRLNTHSAATSSCGKCRLNKSSFPDLEAVSGIDGGNEPSLRDAFTDPLGRPRAKGSSTELARSCEPKVQLSAYPNLLSGRGIRDFSFLQRELTTLID